MKTIFTSLFLLIAVSIYSQKQFNIGVNGGIVTGNLQDRSSSAFGIDANYLFDWFEDFTIGPSMSLVYFSGKGEEANAADSYMYLPIGGAVRYQALDEKFYVGGDLGFAIGLSPDGDRGGVYFKPLIGYNVTESFNINLFYSAVKKKLPTYSYVGLGLTYNILGSAGYAY